MNGTYLIPRNSMKFAFEWRARVNYAFNKSALIELGILTYRNPWYVNKLLPASEYTELYSNCLKLCSQYKLACIKPYAFNYNDIGYIWLYTWWMYGYLI